MPAPRTAIIVNRQSGTVRSMGEEAVRSLIADAFANDSDVEIALLDGSEIDGHIQSLLKKGQMERLIVGGGDGTLASAAGLVAGTDVVLGVLPLGTMNMMAQTIGMASDLAAALKQLHDAEVKAVDAGRAGGRLFLHGVSFGIQPRVVRIRERLGYRSRLTKMLAGLRALAAVIFNPQSLRLFLEVDGREMEIRTPALVVSNNAYENSMMLKQARLDEGVLGLYALSPMSLPAYLRLTFDLLRGRWRDNMNVKEMRPRRMGILRRRLYGRNRRGIKASLDGELVLFELPLEIVSEPAAIRMLVPRATAA